MTALQEHHARAHVDLAWRGFGTLGISVLIAAMIAMFTDSSFGHALIYSCAIGLLCWLAVDGGRALACSVVLRLRHAPPETQLGWPGWPVMVGVIGLGTPVAYALGTWLGDLVTGQHTLERALSLRHGAAVMVLISAVIGAVITGFFYARGRLALARAEAEAAQRLAAENQLRLLQSQLEPHMLFNTLANLRVLIGSDPVRAQAMLDRLIAFLRATLGASRRPQHALAAEFERTADYLALMMVRMGPRLKSELDLPGELGRLEVPSLLLQPLVENAIRHGLEPQRAGGCVRVSARRDGTRLVLEVTDDGVGIDPGRPEGFGTTQVRERLAALYGGDAAFTLAPGAAGGTRATITLPLPATAPSP